MVSVIAMLLAFSVVLAGMFYFFFLHHGNDIGKTANFAHIVEAIAVSGALLVATVEYQWHKDEEDMQRRRETTVAVGNSIDPHDLHQAIIDLRKNYAPQVVRNSQVDINKYHADFEEQTSSLLGLFFRAEGCIRLKVCGGDMNRIFANEFTTYCQAHLKVYDDVHETNRRFRLLPLLMEGAKINAVEITEVAAEELKVAKGATNAAETDQKLKEYRSWAQKNFDDAMKRQRDLETCLPATPG